MGRQFPLSSVRGLGLQVTFAEPSRQAAVEFQLTFGAQLWINRERAIEFPNAGEFAPPGGSFCCSDVGDTLFTGAWLDCD